MRLQERYNGIIRVFSQTMPSPQTELEYDSDFHLLVAVILSAQCTDKRVNIVTPALFEAFPTAYELAKANEDDVYPYIKSVNYPRSKAKHLVGAARKIVDDFGGEVPSDMDALLTLPGVGRKTANVMLAVVWGKAAMAVDTHVFRVSNRIGLTVNSPNPLATEKALVRHFPAEILPMAHHWLILHGRYVCTARRPKCMDCVIKDYCRTWQNGTPPQSAEQCDSNRKR